MTPARSDQLKFLLQYIRPELGIKVDLHIPHYYMQAHLHVSLVCQLLRQRHRKPGIPFAGRMWFFRFINYCCVLPRFHFISSFQYSTDTKILVQNTVPTVADKECAYYMSARYSPSMDLHTLANLRHLVLATSEDFPTSCLPTGLHSLELSNASTVTSGSSLAGQYVLPRLPHLRYLQLRGIRTSFEEIFNACPSLTSLSVSLSCIRDHTSTCDALCRLGRQLRSLYLSGSATVHHALCALPRLTSLVCLGPSLYSSAATPTVSLSLVNLVLQSAPQRVMSTVTANARRLRQTRNTWLQFVVTLIHARSSPALRYQHNPVTDLHSLPLELLELVCCGDSEQHRAVFAFIMRNFAEVLKRVRSKTDRLRIGVYVSDQRDGVRVNWAGTPISCELGGATTIK